MHAPMNGFMLSWFNSFNCSHKRAIHTSTYETDKQQPTYPQTSSSTNVMKYAVFYIFAMSWHFFLQWNINYKLIQFHIGLIYCNNTKIKASMNSHETINSIILQHLAAICTIASKDFLVVCSPWHWRQSTFTMRKASRKFFSNLWIFQKICTKLMVTSHVLYVG